MKDKKLPYNALTMGYILIPKMYFMDCLNQQDHEFCYQLAFLAVIAKVNYKDTIVNFRGTDIMCRRGESVMSTPKWAEVFHWTVGKTRRFFDKMEKEGKIKITPVNYWVRRIQVVDYELWVSRESNNWEETKTHSEEMFEKFWNEYHEETLTRKVDKELARKEWKKLTQKERELAISQIRPYCIQVNDIRYFKRACNYLKAKSFLDESYY